MKAFLLINGIDTFPGCSKNWNGRGVTWVHTNKLARPLLARAEKIEYWCSPVGRAFGQRDRCEKLYRTLQFYAGWDVTVVGHSNGAAVALEMMRDFPGFARIAHLALVCGACESNFHKSGLNDWLEQGSVGRVTVCVAGRDVPLRLAHSLPARLLGYGVMGLGHDLHVRPSVRDRVTVVRGGRWAEYGHSTCWEDQNLDDTMGMLAGVR